MTSYILTYPLPPCHAFIYYIRMRKSKINLSLQRVIPVEVWINKLHTLKMSVDFFSCNVSPWLLQIHLASVGGDAPGQCDGSIRSPRQPGARDANPWPPRTTRNTDCLCPRSLSNRCHSFSGPGKVRKNIYSCPISLLSFVHKWCQ